MWPRSPNPVRRDSGAPCPPTATDSLTSSNSFFTMFFTTYNKFNLLRRSFPPGTNTNPLKLIIHSLHLQDSSSSPSAFLPSVRLSPTHLNYLLNDATHAKNIKHAAQIHARIITHNYMSYPFLFNNLLNLYAKCGQLDETFSMFSTIEDGSKNVVTWTSLITRLSHSNKSLQALIFFNRMRSTGVYPNHFTFSAVLPACADTAIVYHGQQHHSLISKHGLELYVFVESALIDMYAKCGDMKSAERVFDEMPVRNLVSWNSLLVGFLQNNSCDRAFEFFRKVAREDTICPDQVSFSSVLSACANVDGVVFGRQLHGVVFKNGLIFLAYVMNSLLDMYCKCDFFEDAAMLFQTTEHRDVVAWNVMIMGCVQNAYFEDACKYFWNMKGEGISPDQASFSTALHAVASMAALDQGSLIHGQIFKNGFTMHICVASSLITMYAKCGCLIDAHYIFVQSEHTNIVSWTAMISAFQQHGCSGQVIELFEGMLKEGIKPDHRTFVCVLSACSHTGRVNEGLFYFDSMTKSHNMCPGHEHYACIIDMLGRAGRLDEAKRFLESMPTNPGASAWGALLGACRKYGNLEIGRVAAERLFEIEPDNPGNYMLLFNLFTLHGRMREADETRRLMMVHGIRKESGCSSIDIKNTAHVFTDDDI